MELTVQHKAVHYASLYLENEIQEAKESLEFGHHVDTAKELIEFRLSELEKDFKQIKSIKFDIDTLD